MKRSLRKKWERHHYFFDKTAPKKNIWRYRAVMLTSSNLSLFSPDKREELQHDLSCAAPSIEDWKSHVLRSVHQDAAKSEIVDSLKPSQVLLIMDWAMKFIPTSFRETQRDWFGKKGKSWHLSVAITKAEDGTIEVEIMCLLFCLYRSLTTIN